MWSQSRQNAVLHSQRLLCFDPLVITWNGDYCNSPIHAFAQHFLWKWQIIFTTKYLHGKVAFSWLLYFCAFAITITSKCDRKLPRLVAATNSLPIGYSSPAWTNCTGYKCILDRSDKKSWTLSPKQHFWLHSQRREPSEVTSYSLSLLLLELISSTHNMRPVTDYSLCGLKPITTLIVWWIETDSCATSHSHMKEGICSRLCLVPLCRSNGDNSELNSMQNWMQNSIQCRTQFWYLALTS
jgi:hypothetical protein